MKGGSSFNRTVTHYFFTFEIPEWDVLSEYLAFSQSTKKAREMIMPIYPNIGQKKLTRSTNPMKLKMYAAINEIPSIRRYLLEYDFVNRVRNGYRTPITLLNMTPTIITVIKILRPGCISLAISNVGREASLAISRFAIIPAVISTSKTVKINPPKSIPRFEMNLFLLPAPIMTRKPKLLAMTSPP